MSKGKGIGIAVGFLLLVTAGILAQSYSFTITGTQVNASFGMYPSAYAFISAAGPEDRNAYLVDWGSCSPNFDYEHRICVSAGGLASKSAFKFHQPSSLTIDLDIANLTTTFFVTGENCSTGICVSFTPDTVPLRGTLTAYHGTGSSYTESSGNSRSESNFGVKWSDSFTGHRLSQTARFEGVVGALTLPPPGIEGKLTVSRGRQTTSVVYPPVYPPMP